MNQKHSTTEAGSRRKGTHLSFDHRCVIAVFYKHGKYLRSIAAEICYAPNTVRNELKRGQRLTYNGKCRTYALHRFCHVLCKLRYSGTKGDGSMMRAYATSYCNGVYLFFYWEA
ncbi:helix-turn-helix domain-containing protein [Synergistes jonesii]|uniref:helix-turn-helix domain-containing protein n=1 Tax=Synergistes jonesii TaxID=2754 RepID=UPI0038B381D8